MLTAPIFDDSPHRRLRLVGRPIGATTMSLPPRSPGPAVRPTDLWLFQTRPSGLAQVEYVRELPRTLVPRMRFYREVITRTHPYEPLEQYVIVVGDGRLRPVDDPVDSGDHCGLHVLYLSDVDPPAFRSSPGFTLLARCTEAPPLAELLIGANLTLGRFLVSLQDGVHGDAVLHDSGGPAAAGIPQQLLSLFFQGRFGDHPEVPVERRGVGWPIDVAVALAVHAITHFDQVRSPAVRRGRG
jgi:hypothetical protein